MPAIGGAAEQDCLSLLTALIDKPRERSRMRQLVGLDPQRLEPALRELRRRELIRHLGNGYWSAEQRTCNVCSRSVAPQQALRFDPETWVWSCEPCWESRIAELERLLSG